MNLRKRFWGVVGSLAVMTSGASAGEPHSQPRAVPGAGQSVSANQHAANEVAAAIAREVTDRGYTVSLDVRDGVVTLRGVAASPCQLSRIHQAVRSRPFVKQIVNEMKVGGRNSIQLAGYQEGMPADVPAPIPQAPNGQALTPVTPEFTHPQGGAPQYDAPFMPPFAWPSRAPYPNYSAVQYPKVYPNTAWPHIGPFHPYPEAPLDWREVTLKSHAGLHLFHTENEPPPEWSKVKLRWDDGHWYLNFCHKWWGGRSWLSGIGHTERVESTGCGSCMPGKSYHVKFDKKVCTHLYMD
jgi:hypothetical protein